MHIPTCTNVQQTKSNMFTAMDRKVAVETAPAQMAYNPIICHEPEKTHSFGIFYGENPLEYSFPLLLLEISTVILITRLVACLLKPLKQPRIVSEIIGGILVGPSVLGRSKRFSRYMFPTHAEFILKNVAVMGFMYFLFVSGVKMDIAPIKRAGKKQWYIALFGVVAPILTTGTVAVCVRKSLGKEMGKASSIWGVCSALSITAFPVLYPIIRDLNLLNSDMGRMALATSIISDLIGISGLIAFEAAKQGEAKGMAALWYMISLTVIMAGVIRGTRQLMIWVVKMTPDGKPVDQIYVVAILLGVMMVGFVSDTCGLAIANGPLLLGLAVPDGPPLGATVVQKSETFVMEILMPFSFTLVGLLTDIGTMKENWPRLEPLFYMALTGYFTKFLSTFLVALFFRMPMRDGIALSLIMSLRGQVEILLFIHWMDLRMLDVPLFSMMVVLTTMVTAVVTPLINMVYDPTRPYMVNKRRTIQHTAPNTELHIVACMPDEESVAGFVHLLDISNPTLGNTFCLYALHLTDLIARAAPVFIDHNQDPDDTIAGTAERHTTGKNNIIQKALQQFQEARGNDMRFRFYTSVSPKRSMYQVICELALEKKASLILLHYQSGCLGSYLIGPDQLAKSTFQSVNSTVLAHAPCSVAVLVDKGVFKSPLLSSSAAASMQRSGYQFAVLFLGGPDAREALAYADRMAGNPDVSLTVIRFLSMNGEGDDEMEKKLDDGLVTWFWVKNEGNNRVIYREVVVRNGDETVAAIRAMDAVYYDLWIVGRKLGINPVLIQGLANWSDNLELGVIGDYVASMDLATAASVLVVQQQVLRDEEEFGLRGRFERYIYNRLRWFR